MIKQFKYIWVLLIILSCKASNEKIKVNAIKLEYNILFNGDNYFNEGLEVLKNNYKENYWLNRIDLGILIWRKVY